VTPKHWAGGFADTVDRAGRRQPFASFSSGPDSARRLRADPGNEHTDSVRAALSSSASDRDRMEADETLLAINWCGHTQQVVPWSGTNDSWVLVPIVDAAANRLHFWEAV